MTIALGQKGELMDDVISRQAAITLPVIPKEHREYQTFNLDDAYEQGWNDLQKCIESLPSAQPTLYGYNIAHLEIIARVLQKENLPPERIVEVLTDIGRIVAIVKDEYEEALRKAVEQCRI